MKSQTQTFGNFLKKNSLVSTVESVSDEPKVPAKLSPKNLKNQSFEQFSQISVFEVFCEGNRFPESWGWHLCSFDHVELMSVLDDCGKCLFSFSIFFVSLSCFSLRGKLQKHFPLEDLLHIEWFCFELFEKQIFHKRDRKQILRFQVNFLKVHKTFPISFPNTTGSYTLPSWTYRFSDGS